MKTKRFAVVLAVLLMFSTLFSVTAAAEEDEGGKSSEKETIVIGSDAEDTLRLETGTEIGDLIEVTPHAARVCDTLGKYGYESDEKNEFVIVDLDICNISKDIIDLEQLISASFVYKDEYSFEVFDGAEVDEMNQLLLGTWEGIWEISFGNGYRHAILTFTEVNKKNEVEGTIEYEPYDYKGDYINDHYGKYIVTANYDENALLWNLAPGEWIDNPDEWKTPTNTFRLYMPGPNVLCGTRRAGDNSQDYGFIYLTKQDDYAESTELDVMEEMSYSLVFKIPNRIVKDLDNCAVYISVDGEVYEVPLQ